MGNAIPPNILGEHCSPNYVRTRGNGDTVAFHQVDLQRNAKSIVKVNSSFYTKVKCPISYIVICIGEQIPICPDTI